MTFFGSIKVKFGRKKQPDGTQPQEPQQQQYTERISRQDTVGMNPNPGSSSWAAPANSNPFLDPASAANPDKQPRKFRYPGCI